MPRLAGRRYRAWEEVELHPANAVAAGTAADTQSPPPPSLPPPQQHACFVTCSCLRGDAPVGPEEHRIGTPPFRYLWLPDPPCFLPRVLSVLPRRGLECKYPKLVKSTPSPLASARSLRPLPTTAVVAAPDAYQLRNEAAFINDFRDSVRQTTVDAHAGRSRRRPNAAMVTVIVGRNVHALLWATEPIAERREVLLDYGDHYWRAYEAALQANASSSSAPAQRQDEEEQQEEELETHEPIDRER
jgi:hypothetical protein|eukprot:SAG25_NODE_28_length_20925_cov_13.342839_6_plen_244_part_00